MASYNELNALIDAYINRNGVQAITGQILNGVLKAMVEQLGRGYTIMGAATPTTDPGTPDGPECYFASATGTYTDFDGLQVVPGELALLCYTPSDGWTKATIYEGFREVGATIDGNVGTPSVGVSYADGVLSFDFHNMKGDPGQNGQDGQDGAAAGFGTIGADITGGVGTPGVSVESSGPATAKNLQFHFTNLKGETGVTSVVATVDNTTGTPACTVSLVGQQLTLAFSGLKGAQGDTGSSVDYPFTIVNNLTTDDATQALSAAQGVVLEDEITQLEAEVDEFAIEVGQGFPTTEIVEGETYNDDNGNTVANSSRSRTGKVPYISNPITNLSAVGNGLYEVLYWSNGTYLGWSKNSHSGPTTWKAQDQTLPITDVAFCWNYIFNIPFFYRKHDVAIEGVIDEKVDSKINANVPFFGERHLGYISSNKWAGLSEGYRYYRIAPIPSYVLGQTYKIKAGTTQAIIYFLSAYNPVEGGSVSNIGSQITVNAGAEHSGTIPNEARYIYILSISSPDNREPVSFEIAPFDLMANVPSDFWNVNGKVESISSFFGPKKQGYIQSGNWKSIGTGYRYYRIAPIPDFLVGKSFVAKGSANGSSVLFFLSAYDPVTDATASPIGSQITISTGADYNGTIPSGAKFLYMLSYSYPDNREPQYIRINSVDLIKDVQGALLSFQENLRINGTNIVEESVSGEKMTIPLQMEIPFVADYMEAEVLASKNKIDTVVNAESCSVGLMTDLHIVPNDQYADNTVAVRKSFGTLAVMSKQIPLAFVNALGDYVGGFTPDSKETGIRAMEYVNEMMGMMDCKGDALPGNHELQWFGGSAYGLTPDEFFALVGNKYIQKYGLTISFKDQYRFVLYADDVVSKTRHIFLNSIAGSYINSMVSGKVADAAESAPSGYGIVVYCHYGVDVWQSGGYVSPVVFSYVQTTIDAIKTRLNGTDKELIAWVAGHTHIDTILVYNGTIVVSLLRGAFDLHEGVSQDGITYNGRVMGTPSEQTATIMTIRRDLGKLYFTRVGYGVDMEANYNAQGGQTIGRVFNGLSGIVYDTDGTTPLAGATVSVQFIGATYTTTTDASGSYSFDKLPNESGKLSVSMSGHTFTDIPLTISGTMTQNVTANS